MLFSARNVAATALGICLLWATAAPAGTLRIVTYNINADTNGSGGVGTVANNQSLTTVLQAIGQQVLAGNAQPIDVLALEELSWVGSGTSPTLQIVVNDLDSIYPGSNYAYDPTYDPTDGNATGNGPSGLVYNTNTVKDLGGATSLGYGAGSAPRAPMRYDLQPVGGVASSQFYLYVVHAKSGGSSYYSERNSEAQEVRADSATLGASANVIYTGDFNWDSGEPSYLTYTASGVGQGIDPGYTAGLFTEKATNLEYRDDAQIVTAPVLNGSGGLKLGSASYAVFGNNGSTGNSGSVNQSGNTALTMSNSATVLAALTTATDHLPVVADYSFTTPATISLGSVLNATIITGGTASLGATVANSAAAGSNDLNFTLGAAVQSGSATLGSVAPGSSGSLAPSSRQACTVSATSANVGVNVISFTAADPNASNLAQTTTATLTVLDHAAGSATVTSGNGFLVHAGATGLSATVSVNNAGGMRSGLQVNSVPSIGSGTLSGGPATPYYVSAGSVQTYTATFNAGSTAGAFNDTVTLASVGDNQSLPGANSLGGLSVSITGNVFSGKAQWSAANGVWAANGNWQDTVGGGPSGPPGLAGYATDTATFGTAVASGTVAVSLNSASPLLSNLVFNAPNAGYAIMQGTGTTGLTLTGTDGSSPAALTVMSGEHWVETPVLLDSNLVVSSSGSLTLSGDISDGGLAKGLALDGPGTLILSGTNSYRGGTVVQEGDLCLANGQSLADNSSLVVGAGGTFIFDPTLYSATATDADCLAQSVSPVPEPGTLAMLAAGAICCLAARGWSPAFRRLLRPLLSYENN